MVAHPHVFSGESRCEGSIPYTFDAWANFIQRALRQPFPSFFESCGLQRWHSSVWCVWKLGICTQRSSLSTSASHKLQCLSIIGMQSAHPASISSWSKETLSWPIALLGYGVCRHAITLVFLRIHFVTRWWNNLWEEALLAFSKFSGYTVAIGLSSSCRHVKEV